MLKSTSVNHTKTYVHVSKVVKVGWRLVWQNFVAFTNNNERGRSTNLNVSTCFGFIFFVRLIETFNLI